MEYVIIKDGICSAKLYGIGEARLICEKSGKFMLLDDYVRTNGNSSCRDNSSYNMSGEINDNSR